MLPRPAVLAAALVACLAAPARAAGPHVEIVKGDFRFTPAGYIQGDFRSFHDWEAGDEDTGNLRGETSELRRLRLGFELEYRKLSIEVDVDPRDDGDELKDLYAELKLHDAFRLPRRKANRNICGALLCSSSHHDVVLQITAGPCV